MYVPNEFASVSLQYKAGFEMLPGALELHSEEMLYTRRITESFFFRGDKLRVTTTQ